MDMKVKDFDSYKVPNRKPWAILIVLLAAGVLSYFIFFRGDDENNLGVDANEIVSELDGDKADQNSGQPSISEPAPKESVEPILPEVTPTGDIAVMLDAATRLVTEDRLVEARAKYIAALKCTSDQSIQRQIEQKLDELFSK